MKIMMLGLVTVMVLNLTGCGNVLSGLHESFYSVGGIRFSVQPAPNSAIKSNAIFVQQNLRPDESLQAVSFIITGTGPGGATFSHGTDAGNVVTGLVPGEWQLTAEAKNEENNVIGQGTKTVTVSGGSAVTAQITVTDLVGDGTLRFNVYEVTNGTRAGSRKEISDFDEFEYVFEYRYSEAGDEEYQELAPTPEGEYHFEKKLPAGNYLFQVKRTDDDGDPSIVRRFSARIAAGMTTTGKVGLSEDGAVVENDDPEPGRIRGGERGGLINDLTVGDTPFRVTGFSLNTGKRTITASVEASGDFSIAGLTYAWSVGGVEIKTGGRPDADPKVLLIPNEVSGSTLITLTVSSDQHSITVSAWVIVPESNVRDGGGVGFDDPEGPESTEDDD